MASELEVNIAREVGEIHGELSQHIKNMSAVIPTLASRDRVDAVDNKVQEHISAHFTKRQVTVAIVGLALTTILSTLSLLNSMEARYDTQRYRAASSGTAIENKAASNTLQSESDLRKE